ncbi:hypothetical protein F975_02028 [Acinetobacter sp. ANC 3789]|uniref:hypothetical protein n=1 Tax=Acinetobacter sp. ANC 3789 TaxID=1217714 RepID=UPI0002CF076B|nr:hypothetical protein [Acinetobacter sp. ANC 3789]ENU80273.1 hypothetical protein F975_02028 [Acinetobacter sp. ANC 3789]
MTATAAHPRIEQLIESHLDFLEQEFSQPKNLHDEVQAFFHWFTEQNLQDLWNFQSLFNLLEQQVLKNQLSAFFVEQCVEHIRFALVHDLNDHTKIADIFDVMTIDKIAQYVASKTEHRHKLIHRVVNHPAFSAMISQLIQQALEDYFEHSMGKRVPTVGRFMKMGKSVFESVTDSRFEQTVAHYLQKNIVKLSQLSEQVLNQHFDNDKLYHFQANLWHKIKASPLSVFKNYIVLEDLPHTVGLAHEVWNHLRQTDYLKQQLHDGLYTWYVRNQERNFRQLLRDLNIDEGLLMQQLQPLFASIMQQAISSGFLRQRARGFLERFYYAETTRQILAFDNNQE